MTNVFRFIAYTFRGTPRHSHRRGFFRKHAVTFLAGFMGALVLAMPAWMILLGVI